MSDADMQSHSGSIDQPFDQLIHLLQQHFPYLDAHQSYLVYYHSFGYIYIFITYYSCWRLNCSTRLYEYLYQRPFGVYFYSNMRSDEKKEKQFSTFRRNSLFTHLLMTLLILSTISDYNHYTWRGV